MAIFTSATDRETFAKDFIEHRLKALEKDIPHCLNGSAAFPAILSCFSTIDLFGALAGGNASRNAPTTAQSEAYMKCFMNYTPDQVELLQKLFRHKLVHLAQPKAVVAFQNNKKVTWHYSHTDASRHLKLNRLPSAVTQTITGSLSVVMDHEFSLSISNFVEDICQSVRRSGGYMERLKIDPILQGNFDIAIEQIYTP